MEDLVNELRLSMHRFVQVAENLHAEEPITIGMRAVLEFLLRNSAATVPEMARSRHVTRQLIQTQVNPLLDQGLVALRDNPAHRRSPHVVLTRSGERMIQRMRRREAGMYESMSDVVSEAQIETATRTLRAIRCALPEDEK